MELTAAYHASNTTILPESCNKGLQQKPNADSVWPEYMSDRSKPASVGIL